MNLHQLRVFAALVSRGSYTAAAEHLHLSQPAISQQVKALETSCGVRLVERRSNRVEPTHAGEVLLKYASSILHLESQAEHALEEIRSGQRGRFVLGANTTGGMYIVPPIIAAYREQHPETEVILRIDGTELLVGAVASGSVDIAVVGGPITDRRLNVEPVVPDKLVLIAAPTHPLAGSSSVQISSLADVPFVVARYGSTTRRLIETKLRQHGVTLRIAMEMAGTEDIKKAVEAGLGVAVVSQWSVLREVSAGYLRQVEILGADMTRHYEMLTHKHRYFAPAAEGFLAFMRQYGPKLTFPHLVQRGARL